MSATRSQYPRCALARRLSQIAQSRDDRGGALVFRTHHPVGDEAETDTALGIGEADLSPRAVMSKVAIGEIAPSGGVELEAITPAAEGWLATKDGYALALCAGRLGDGGMWYGVIALLPLALGSWTLALVFSVLNAAVLCWRIRVEEGSLAPRRTTA